VAKETCGDDHAIDTDLAYLVEGTDEFHDYAKCMDYALAFAYTNRLRMLDRVLEALHRECYWGFDVEPNSIVNIHHNYAAPEWHFGERVWIHRKGATNADAGRLGIIPGSMGTNSYIVRGLGNPESFSSCSHGAGRLMSRTGATKCLDVGACDAAMKGISFGGWNTVKRGRLKGRPDLGESPLAYKDIDEVIANQADLVEIVQELQPLAVVKG
jgi:tRNA-splicing ligase RtcB